MTQQFQGVQEFVSFFALENKDGRFQSFLMRLQNELIFKGHMNNMSEEARDDHAFIMNSILDILDFLSTYRCKEREYIIEENKTRLN